jgi:hypothetical protein
LLEKEISTSFILPSYDKNKSTLIRDGMGIIQSLNAKRYNTFGELAKDYFGIGPTGYAKTFSTLTSSRTFARAKALRKTSSG